MTKSEVKKMYAVYSTKQTEESGSVFYRDVKTNKFVEVSEVQDTPWTSNWDDAKYFEVYCGNPLPGKQVRRFWERY